MNERIQELMVELKKTVSTHRGAEVLIGYDEIEKLAELIVRECLNIVNDEITDARCIEPFDRGYISGLSVATEVILQHFGIVATTRMQQDNWDDY